LHSHDGTASFSPCRYATSEDSEVLWRLARVVCEKAKLCKDDNERKRLFFEAFSLVEKALKCQPPTGSFGANKWSVWRALFALK
jgi:hypothetical protein